MIRRGMMLNGRRKMCFEMDDALCQMEDVASAPPVLPLTSYILPLWFFLTHTLDSMLNLTYEEVYLK